MSGRLGHRGVLLKSSAGGSPNLRFLLNGDAATGFVDHAGHPLTIGSSNVQIITSDPDYPDGVIDFPALGLNDLITVAGSYGTDFTFPADTGSGAGPVTIEFEYKPNTTKGSSYPTILAFTNNYTTNGGIGIYERHLSALTKVSLALNGGTPLGFPAVDGPVSSAGVIAKWAIQRDAAGLLVIFKDGVPVDSGTYTGLIATTSSSIVFTLGKQAGTNDSLLKGRLCKIRITAEALYDPVLGYTPISGYFPV